MHVIIVIQIINQPVRPPVTNNIIMHNIETEAMTITPTAATTLVERITGAKEGSTYQVSYYATNVVDIFSTTLNVLGKYMEIVSLLLIIIHFDNVIYIYIVPLLSETPNGTAKLITSSTSSITSSTTSSTEPSPSGIKICK